MRSPESWCLDPENSSHKAGKVSSSNSSHVTKGSSIWIRSEVDLTLGSWTDLSNPIISRSMSSLSGRGGLGDAEPAAIIGGTRPIPQFASGASMTPRATVRPGPFWMGRRRQGTAADSSAMGDTPLMAFWALILVFNDSRDAGKARHCNIATVGSNGITQNRMDNPL